MEPHPPPTAPIARPSPSVVSSGLAPYLADVLGNDARAALAAQVDEVSRLLDGLPEARALHRYTPGKWSVKEVLGHLCDAERVYAYRMLRFARNDSTPLPGFDENCYVPAGQFDARSMSSLVAEWQAIRRSTLALVDGFPTDALDRSGVANGWPFTVRTLAWLAAGHTSHHLRVLRERYGLG